MKLSKLYCNQATFKNIRFNLKGLNVISADVKSSLNDKKNSHGQVKYALLESIGSCRVDVIVEDKLVDEAFAYYAT